MARANSGPRAKLILDDKQTEQLEFLAGIGCTLIEMAAFFKCHADTLRDNYSTHIQTGRENGKASVRRIMWEQGKRGNSVALKYLVTNILKEKVEEYVVPENNHLKGMHDAIQEFSKENLIKIIKDAEKKVS